MSRRSWSLSRRKMDGDENIPLSENPAFEGAGYDSINNAFDDRDNDTRIDSYIEPDPDFVDSITADLPSKNLRRTRSALPPETLRLRSRARGAVDEETSWEPGATFSSRDQITPSDVIIDPDQMTAKELSHASGGLRDMTTTMRHKREYHTQLEHAKSHPAPGNRKISGWKQTKYSCSLGWKRFKESMKQSFSSLHIWEGHLKEVQGTFGTGVLSYFVFLRWLLYLNLLMCLLLLAFLFVPQMLLEQSVNDNNVTFTGIELITGEGWFNETELYYGRYSNGVVQKATGFIYHLPYAYLFVGGGYLIICLLILAISMATSYRDNFIVGGYSQGSYTSKVFCSWDFAITDKSAALLKHQSTYQDMMESLGDDRGEIEITSCQKCCLTFLRILTNFGALCLICGSCYLINYVSGKSVERKASTIIGLLPAITISAINLIMPSAFRLLASIESYHSAKVELTVTLARTVVLKIASLTIYVVTLYKKLTDDGGNSEWPCWENFVGAAAYKLVIIDFITILLYTIIETFRKIFATNIQCVKTKIGLPGFDISKHVLDLIYAQGVCWLGTFFAPLLPVIVVIKLIIVFYIKKLSVTRNCRPSMRPFKATKMTLLFLVLLSFMLILAMVVSGYIIMNKGELKPSSTCGPFRGRPSIYQVVTSIIENDFPSWFGEIIGFVTDVSVIFTLLFLIGIIGYYLRMRKLSTEKKIKILKHQLALAGQDKKFLIAKLRALMRDTAQLQHSM